MEYVSIAGMMVFLSSFAFGDSVWTHYRVGEKEERIVDTH